MDIINENIAAVINDRCNGNKSAFARQIGITPQYAAQIYSGQRVPSDRTILDICRIYHVNEVWLRTGQGPMYSATAEEDAITASLAEAAARSDNAKQRILRALASMPEEYFPAMETFIMSWITDNKDKLPPQQPPQP